MKKWLCILLALTLALGGLAGCGAAEEAPAPTPEAETETPVETESAEPQPLDFAAARNAYALDTAVMTVDGTEIGWDLYFSAVCEYLYSFYSRYGITDFSLELEEGRSIAELAKDYAFSVLSELTMLRNKAAEFGVTLDETQRAVIDGEYEYYAALLDELGISEAYYRAQMEAPLYYSYAFPEYLFGEDYADFSAEDALAWAEDNGYIRAKHILLKTVDDSYDPLDEETVAEKRALAEDILGRLRAADESVRAGLFDTLMNEFSEDPGGLASFPDGYTFTDGDMIPEFYAGAQALADGEISDLVEGYYGYHIIRRLPLDADLPTMEQDSAAYRYRTLRELAAMELFENMLDEWYAAQDARYVDGFETLDVTALFPQAGPEAPAEETPETAGD